jgi:hypothetical protein
MEDTAKNNDNNGVITEKGNANPFNPENKLPTRQDVLLLLWNRSKWIADKIDNSHTKFTPQLETRVRYAKTECQFYQAILDGLKDVEIDELAKQLAEIKEAMKQKGVS